MRVRGGSFMLVATDGGIFERGASNVWNETGSGLVANGLLIDSADSTRCYAACEGGFYRSLKDYDRALLIMRRVQGLHAAIYGPASQTYADDFTRMAQIYAEQKKAVPAIAIRRWRSGPGSRFCRDFLTSVMMPPSWLDDTA